MKRSMLLTAALALLGTGAWAADPTFTFGFEGFPDSLKGAAGTEVSVEGFLTVTSADIPVTDPFDFVTQEGIQGWSYGLEVAGAAIDSVATFDPITPNWEDTRTTPDTKGLDIAAPTLRASGSANLTLYNAGFQVLEAAYATKAPRDPLEPPIGAVSAIVLNQTKKQLLVPNTTTRIAKLVLKATVPVDPGTVHLEFKAGLFGSGEPVGNVVTYMSASQTPVLGVIDIPISSPTAEYMLALVGAGQTEFGPGPQNEMIVEGEPGSTAEFFVDVLMKTELLPGVEGPQGWSFGFRNSSNITADPLQFVMVGENEDIPTCLQGIKVDTLFGDTLVPRVLDLANAGFKVAEPAYDDKAPHAGDPIGVVTAIVLNQTKKQVLNANATDRVLSIKYSGQIPAIDQPPAEATLAMENGLYGSGEPVGLVITYESASKFPTTMQSLKVTLKPKVITKAEYISGEANRDGKIDIADAIWIVYSVVPGLAPGYSIECLDAGDANGDRAVNLADATYIIQYLFQGGAAPLPPWPGCGTIEASTDVTCPADTTICP